MSKTNFKFSDHVDDKSRVRSRPTDYIQTAINTVESYPFGLVHGVQKDAIQNAWDACKIKTKNFVSRNWSFKFELFESERYSYLSMTDKGTWGLTGSMTAEDISPDALPPEDERWARWESLAIPKRGEEDLGARGWGKMILIAASEDYAIIYDSLREDGTYRFGMSQATHIGCPVYHWSGEDAKKRIRDDFGLEALKEQGTRVIIINPVEELVSSLQTGKLYDFIAETWWPLILKFGAIITIASKKQKKAVIIPKYFPLSASAKNTDNFKTWIKDNIKINYEHKEYTIKHLHFACNKDLELPEIHQGIAIFRFCMKVPIIEFPMRNLRPKVYGYVEFDEKIDKELRKIELPNHYGFVNKGLWRKIKDCIETELESFGNDKLGLGINKSAKENAKRNSAESKALGIVKTITKGWGLDQTGQGPCGPDHGSEPADLKDIGLRISGLVFPDIGNIPRVNYGQKLEKFNLTIFNKTDEVQELSYTFNILSGDRVILQLDKGEISLGSKSEHNTGKYQFLIHEDVFPSPGEYRLSATLNNKLLERQEDRIRRRFWVEMDPPLKGPFEVRRLPFSKASPEKNSLEWFLQSEGNNKYTLIYNIDHPTYLYHDADEEKLIPYLTEIFGQAALQLLIKRLSSEEIKIDKKEIFPFSIDNLLSEDPKISSAEYARAFAAMREQIYELVV